jgi:hypothetical protein
MLGLLDKTDRIVYDKFASSSFQGEGGLCSQSEHIQRMSSPPVPPKVLFSKLLSGINDILYWESLFLGELIFGRFGIVNISDS